MRPDPVRITSGVVVWHPRFLDIEASGFGPGSWPAAVAWSDVRGVIRSVLVRPDPAWTHWDESSARVHGIARERLAREGLPPEEVTARIDGDLAGAVAFSDAPDYDAAWLGSMYRACGRSPTFRLDHAHDVLVGAMLRPGETLWQVQARLEEAKAALIAAGAIRHDAGSDVGLLVALWRQAVGGSGAGGG